MDVRSPEEYRGEKLAPDHLPQEQSQVPGHVPGAANIPWVKAANEDGTFKSADELKALYEAEGITPDREVIAYCRIGERSSHTWFALQELLGYTNVKNYDGSWTEYGSLVGVPVEIGLMVSELDKMIQANADFAEVFDRRELEVRRPGGLAILTCIDAPDRPGEDAGFGDTVTRTSSAMRAGARRTMRSDRWSISSWLLGTREYRGDPSHGLRYARCSPTMCCRGRSRREPAQDVSDMGVPDLLGHRPERSGRCRPAAGRSKYCRTASRVSGYVYDVRSGALREVVPSSLNAPRQRLRGRDAMRIPASCAPGARLNPTYLVDFRLRARVGLYPSVQTHP